MKEIVMQILKCDLDLKLNKEWLEKWKNTRIAILNALGIYVERIIIEPSSKRGYHVWIHIWYEKMNDIDLNRLQYLIDGETGRALINSWRIKRGIKSWNKIFDHTLWRREHECNCKLHQTHLKRLKEGQKAFRNGGI